MLQLPDSWVWDSWCVDDGEQYHLFFLFASRALLDPARRHLRASIGHAVSTDLRRWRRVPDALVRGVPGTFDDLAVWTGSVIRHAAGGWSLFYTGATRTEAGVVQSIGVARSDDLISWRRTSSSPVLKADPRWYETLADGTWDDQAFRDPFVFADEDGNGFHMLITARANHGAVDDRGVVGHAWSPDLDQWQLREPLSGPGCGFAQYEVMQVRRVAGARAAVLLVPAVGACPLDRPGGFGNVVRGRRVTARPLRPERGAGYHDERVVRRASRFRPGARHVGLSRVRARRGATGLRARHRSAAASPFVRPELTGPG